MKLSMFVIFYLYCIQQGDGYFYPICSSNDKTCVTYLSRFSYYWPFSRNEDEHGADIVENAVQSVVDPLSETLDNIFSPLNHFYNGYVHPVMSRMYTIVINDLTSLKHEYSSFAKSIPFLKYEQKAKANNRLYSLFIVTSLGIYLVLYVYFTKKLYYYYQRRLREQYLNKVKKMFKGKQ